jgi:hypothetical protein
MDEQTQMQPEAPPAPARIDEQARRRPTFDEATSEPVTLGDGQDWHVPKPRIRFRFAATERGFTEAFSHGREYDALMQRWREAKGEASLRAEFAVFAFLLRVNYELSDDDLADLLVFDLDDDTETVLTALAWGNDGPKRTSAGSD